MKHEQAYKDRSYLFSLAPAYDMTGGYEDQYDLEDLLMNPNKRTATKCLVSQIRYWFTRGTEGGSGRVCSSLYADDPVVVEIAERHGCEFS